MSQTLTRAHDELYKRTPDERFATLQELWDCCQARKQRSELLWRSADDLSSQNVIDLLVHSWVFD